MKKVGLRCAAICVGIGLLGGGSICKSGYSQVKEYGDLENRPLLDVLQERSTTKDPDRMNKIDSFLREKAAPKTTEDLKFVEAEISQKDEYRRRRGLNWLEHVQDQNVSPELLRFLKEKTTQLPPERVDELAKQPAKDIEETSNQEILGAIMLKLGDLKERAAIPILRAYAKAETSGNIHTKIGAAAYMALARMKDEEFFGPDRRARLSAHHVDFDDPATKPWLKETMLNDPDLIIRYAAGDAWARGAANPEDPSDLDFAWKLIQSTGPNLTINERAARRARGFDVLQIYVARGHFDRKIFDAAIDEAQSKYIPYGSNKYEAAQLLGAFGARSEYRAQALNTLHQLLSGPDMAARGAAQHAIGKLTGVFPHYEGEVGAPLSNQKR